MSAKLTLKQTLFAKEYLVDLNAAAAAVRAGYSPKSAGWQGLCLMKISGVQELIQKEMREREQRIKISQDKILTELARIAFCNPLDVLSWDGGRITMADNGAATGGIAYEAAAAISELTETAAGIRVRFHDKFKALELLMRHSGMLNDKLAVNMSGSVSVDVCERKALEAQDILRALREQREVAQGAEPP